MKNKIEKYEISKDFIIIKNINGEECFYTIILNNKDIGVCLNEFDHVIIYGLCEKYKSTDYFRSILKLMGMKME